MKIKINYLFVALTAFFYLSSPALAKPLKNGEESCTKQWQILEEQKKPVGDKFYLWRTLKDKKCVATGLYYYKLGGLHLELKEYDAAIKSFNLGLKKPTKYKQELWLAAIDTYVQKGMAIKKVRSKSFEVAQRDYKSYIKKYPKDGRPYNQMADLMLLQKKMKSTVAYGEKAIKLNAPKQPHRSMSIAYQALGKHKQSIESYKKAYAEAKKQVLNDSELMFAVAISYAKLGKYRLAGGALKMAEKQDKNIIKSKEYQQVFKDIVINDRPD